VVIQNLAVILGGAGIGSGAGVIVHLARSVSEGREVNPSGMVDVVEEHK
jgi:hypothetical protein